MNDYDSKVQLTAYPHIVKVEGVCGGQATIRGTRIAVWNIVGYYYKIGMSVEEILADWDYLQPAQVFSALAYYHDNKEEIDRVREENSYEYYLKHHAHADPDKGLELREDFAQRLQQSANAVDAGQETSTADDVADRLNLEW